MSTRKYNLNGRPYVRRRSGVTGYQRSLSPANTLHDTLSHIAHAGLNEAREAEPAFIVRSPKVNAAKKVFKRHVAKLKFFQPGVESLRYFLKGESGLYAVTGEGYDDRADEVLDRMFYFRKVKKKGKQYWSRVPIRTGEESKKKGILPSPLQSLRVFYSPACNFFFKSLTEEASKLRPKDCEVTSDMVMNWAQDFYRDELPKFLLERTAKSFLPDGSPDPASAIEWVSVAEHDDTGIKHVEIRLTEGKEVTREEAHALGMPIDKPFGSDLSQLLDAVQAEREIVDEKRGLEPRPPIHERIMGKAFLHVGKPQLGRQGPDQVGLHLLRLAGHTLTPEQEEHYQNKIWRGEQERSYLGGLGIDVAVNDLFYHYCVRKAATLGLEPQWKEAEAKYRAWLLEAQPLKEQLVQAKRLAQLEFDGDQEEKAKQLRKRDVEVKRVEIQAALTEAGLGREDMVKLAEKYPLRQIAEACLDGLAGLTVTKLASAAADGLAALLEFLKGVFSSGQRVRLPLVETPDDPDFLAAVQKSVSLIEANRLAAVPKPPVFDLRVACNALVPQYGRDVAQRFYDRARLVRHEGDPVLNAERFLTLVQLTREEGASQAYVAKMITNKLDADERAMNKARGIVVSVTKPVDQVQSKPVEPPHIIQARQLWAEWFADDYVRAFPDMSLEDRMFFGMIAAGTPIGVREKDGYKPFFKGESTGPSKEIKKLLKMDPLNARANYDLWVAGKLVLPPDPIKAGRTKSVS